MTEATPRDAIAGLSERLREDIAQLVTAISQAKFSGPRTGVRVKDPSALMDDLTDAATQLDSLLKERDALQARVKELEGIVLCHAEASETRRRWQQWAEDERAKYEARALRAEQERDEAYDRAAKVIDAECERILSKQTPTNDPLSTTDTVNLNLRMMASILPDLSAAVRRLAGPEKEKKE